MPDLLKRYRTMRRFEETPEPAGAKKTRKAKLPLFVIQKHHASHLHYDFRLEMEGVLKSWAVPKGPSYDPSIKRLAMMTEDHPFDYAGFEGIIPEGNYGAGSVIIWDQGTWELIEPGNDPVRALESGKLTFRMFGKKMFGEWALVKIKGRAPKGNEWLLMKHRDEFANAEVEITEVAPRSVVSNRLVDEVNRENQWQSNRPAARGKRAVTVAAKLKSKPAARKTRPVTAAKKAVRTTAAKRPPRRAPSRSPAPPSPGASSRSRSSRVGSRPAARPTPRRRPR